MSKLTISEGAFVGLIITEATVVSPQGISWLNTPGIYSDAQARAWKQVVIEFILRQGMRLSR